MADETVVVQELWPQVLEAVKKRRRFTWILLSQNANVSFYDGATLTLAWVNQGAVDNFVSSDSVPVLEAVLEEVLSRPAAVESVLEQTPPAPLYSMPASTAVPAHAPAATAALPPRPAASAVSTLHRVLGQTAFLMYEQGNSEAAALLADVGNVELIPGNCSGGWAAVLIVSPYLVPRFTDEVLAAIQPVFVHVAGRHGLQVDGVSAALALPEIGDDWRQILQAELDKEAASEQASKTHTKEASSAVGREDLVKGQASECTRYGKTTGRRCRRQVAEWPAYDDLPSPVAACAGHLTPEEREALEQARNRRGKENRARWAELAAREASGGVPEPAANPSFASRPCIGQCTSQERAWGHDSDGASMSCANCDNWVCVSCGQAQVEGVLEFCADCSERESLYDPEPEWERQYDGEVDTGPNPHVRLTAMVNDLVKATGATHREVNARLNRRIGVISRVGADEQAIRRAASAARAWLDQLDSST
ncbi:hypothetical protein OG226_51175 [Streptomyces sp. NBC_01261]|uniref:hypothetical protein n=1 Tax=Streptomyces sp. NBC_01261 TaxID=2903802 RepID=UPI002E3439B4|nr:hypothetical protein [Streptomyces sp. NBC_01261]